MSPQSDFRYSSADTDDLHVLEQQVLTIETIDWGAIDRRHPKYEGDCWEQNYVDPRSPN